MQLFTPFPSSPASIKIALTTFCFLVGMSNPSRAQVVYKFNAIADLEISKAGEKSHYYYNEIDQDYTDFRIGLSNLNLINQLSLGSAWSFNVRLWLQRDKGRKFNTFSIPELNLQWLSAKRKWGLTIGSFINPFGSFNEQQLSTQRNFVGLPLAYSYYTNISSKIGFAPDMGDIHKIPIDSTVQWGSTHLYYGGYASGAMLSWNIKPGKASLKLALVTGAPTQQVRFSKPFNWGVISRLKLQPTYFWEQGFSVSHGTFMQESEVSAPLDNLHTYTQTLIGTDFKLGSGFFEFSGEFIGALYRVPEFNPDMRAFENEGDPLKLSSLSAYLDIKYELPFLQGSYVAYRLDHLMFSKLDRDPAMKWDNLVRRHSLAFGYHINKFILARVAVSTQHVDTKSWDKTQGTFRFVLTAHY